MRLPLRGLSDAELLRTLRVARTSLDGFTRATHRHGSLIRSWVGGASVAALEHYPDGGVVDRRHGSQFFYHCHRAGEAEHGHLHLFWHATRSGRRRHLGLQTVTGAGDWERSAPSHLVAIGLDVRGLPVSIFSVNHWVTAGHWFDATTTLAMLRRFQLRIDGAHADSCAWLTAFVRLYEPVMARVLRARDRVLLDRPDHPAALDDRRIEVVSTAQLNWSDDLSRLDAEVRARGLDAAS